MTGMRSIDLDTFTDRASADAQLQPYVPEPAIRGFLLQNLRREHPPARRLAVADESAAAR